jgi:hypothetical protein
MTQNRRMPTASFTLTEEIIDYIDTHAGVEGRSALVRQMLVDYIHSTEIRQYRHAESGRVVSAFRIMSHHLPDLPVGRWAVHDGGLTTAMSDAEFRSQYVEVDDNGNMP